MKWITRERVRIDRVASIWLISRFVDAQAEFLFAPAGEVAARAQVEGAIPFHIVGAELGQRGDRTAFDAILAAYGLNEPALVLLADWVRSADRKAGAAEGPGIAAMSHGFAAMNLPDARVVELQLPLWDALYARCREKLGGPAAAVSGG